MKFTHNPITSLMVEKVENITTSMTRAGLSDDTYRRQRDKERYLKFKSEQAERQEKMRQEFLGQRDVKLRAAEELTKKKNLKRQKKKQRQKQLKKKAKLLKKLQGEESNQQSISEQSQSEIIQVEQERKEQANE